MEKLRKIFNIAGYVLVGAMALFTVFLIISNASGRIAFIGKYSIVWVKTPSMEDTIPARSYILVEKNGADSIAVGDVIIFISDDPEIAGQFNTHRVVEIIGDNEQFVTKGDNNSVPDEYHARAESVTGKYVKNLPVMTAFGRFLSSKMGIIMAVTVIIGLFTAICLPSMTRTQNDKIASLEKEKAELIEKLISEEVERLKAENKGVDGNGDSSHENR